MKSAILVLSGVIALASVASSGSIEGIIGLAILGKAFVKGAIGAAFLLGAKRQNSARGSFRLGKRSVDDSQHAEESVRDALLQASVVDENDCAKSFVCQLNTVPKEWMSDFERSVHETFAGSESGAIDVGSEAVEFELAAMMGRVAGRQQCVRIYSRCANMSYSDMLAVVESTF